MCWQWKILDEDRYWYKTIYNWKKYQDRDWYLKNSYINSHKKNNVIKLCNSTYNTAEIQTGKISHDLVTIGH